MGAPSAGPLRGAAWKVVHMRITVSHEHPGEVTPHISFHRNPEEIEREKLHPAKMAVSKEEFQDQWNFPMPDFTATETEVTDGSEGAQVPSVPLHGSLRGQVPSVPLHGFLRGLEQAAHCGKTDLQLPLLRPGNG